MHHLTQLPIRGLITAVVWAAMLLWQRRRPNRYDADPGARVFGGDAVRGRMAAERRRADTIILRPTRWYDLAGVILLPVLPLVQWHLYTRQHQPAAFLLPLACFCAVLIGHGLLPPAALPRSRPAYGRQLVTAGILAALAAATAAWPGSGFVLLMRGVLIDLAAVVAAATLNRFINLELLGYGQGRAAA